MPAFRPSPLLALQRLLQDLFGEDELVPFLSLQLGSEGRSMVASLPVSASMNSLTYAAVVAMERRGFIGPLLFDLLVAERPGRESDIRGVQQIEDWPWNQAQLPDKTDSRTRAKVESLRSHLRKGAEAIEEFVSVFGTSSNEDRMMQLYRLRGQFELLRHLIFHHAKDSLAKEVFDGLTDMMNRASMTRQRLTDEQALDDVLRLPTQQLLGTLEMCRAYMLLCATELSTDDSSGT